MVITLIRLKRGPKATFGYLFAKGNFICYTLENTEKIFPAAEYAYELYDSPKNKRKVILLKNVPKRSMIEIHIANEPQELEGCIAVGLTMLPDVGLISSASAFNKLMGINNNEVGTIRIIEV